MKIRQLKKKLKRELTNYLKINPINKLAEDLMKDRIKSQVNFIKNRLEPTDNFKLFKELYNSNEQIIVSEEVITEVNKYLEHSTI